MQEDFHYCTIKVLAQESGFTPEDAQVIAYASQYTDDAVEYQPLTIKGLPPGLNMPGRINGNSFDPICTAHKGIQYLTGLAKAVQRKVYIPFHFLPPGRYSGQGPYDYRCVPNSELAQELVSRACSGVRGKEGDDKIKGLISLGIALHTYADTWSHQKFSGRRSPADNDIERIYIMKNGNYEKLPFFDQLTRNIIPDVGHAEAMNFPDCSYLTWKYEHNSSGIDCCRNNTDIFLDAAYHIYAKLTEFNGTLNNWKAILNKFKKCFRIESDSRKEKYDAYETSFPGISFMYNHNFWRCLALKGDSFEWANFDKDDYTSQQYTALEDKKWFYFHEAAYNQREFVVNSLRQDLL